VIAKQFADDFGKPVEVEKMPDGAATMQELRSEIGYTYGKSNQARITTKNPRARSEASFLRFQIREHKTGDGDHISD
jgi:hypothetical protein